VDYGKILIHYIFQSVGQTAIIKLKFDLIFSGLGDAELSHTRLTIPCIRRRFEGMQGHENPNQEVEQKGSRRGDGLGCSDRLPAFFGPCR
jgi:hypothetical protein